MRYEDADPDPEFYPDGMRRRIDWSIFCGKCGYNLLTLPIIGRCPECGNEYNAKGLNMTGILIPQSATFPASDLIACLVGGWAGLLSFFWYLQAGRSWYLGLVAVFGVITIVQSVFLYRELARFLHCRRLLKQIRGQTGP